MDTVSSLPLPLAQSPKRPPGPRWYDTPAYAASIRRSYILAFQKLRETYGDIVQVSFPRQVLFLFHPNDVRYVLKENHSNYLKSEFFKELSPLLGQGLLTSEGELWREQRRLMSPEFSHQNIARFGIPIVKAAEKLADQWRHSARTGEVRDISADMNQLTFSIVGETLFGSDVGPESHVVAQGLEDVSETAIERMRMIIKLPRTLPTRSNRRAARALDSLNRVVFKIIGARKNGATQNQDLLSRLMVSKGEQRQPNVKLIRDEVMTLMLAGHETTSNALSWTWYLLSQNPDVLQKMKKEIRDVVGDRAPTSADVPKLEYTKRVLLESMRIYPPAPVISRSMVMDDVIHGFPIKNNTIIEVSPWVTHRHPDFWAEPEKFDPDRFTPENQAKQHPFAYFPFGAGPRECIGKAFALFEAQLILATLAQRFTLKLLPGHPVVPQPRITLRIRDGLKMTLTDHA